MTAKEIAAMAAMVILLFGIAAFISASFFSLTLVVFFGDQETTDAIEKPINNLGKKPLPSVANEVSRSMVFLPTAYAHAFFRLPIDDATFHAILQTGHLDSIHFCRESIDTLLQKGNLYALLNLSSFCPTTDFASLDIPTMKIMEIRTPIVAISLLQRKPLHPPKVKPKLGIAM